MSNETETPTLHSPSRKRRRRSTVPGVILDEKYQLHATAARLCVERLQAAGVAGDSSAAAFSAAGAVRHYNGCIELIENRLKQLDNNGESSGGAIPIIGGGGKDA
jgi:hypothetical protein